MDNQNMPPVSDMENDLTQTFLKSNMISAPEYPGPVGFVDRFEIIRFLGIGGMGQVMLAKESVTGANVAIKMIKPELLNDTSTVSRFLSESQHMYGMNHPNIIKVMEVSDRQKGPYYVMPFIEEGSLADRLHENKPLPTETIFSICRQLVDALTYAHQRGIIHRDLKPGNILMNNTGQVYLTDFGLARTVFNDTTINVQDSQLEGTAAYMSPGVAAGKAEDTRCDTYAFGAILYEMLTGIRPFDGTSNQEIIEKVKTSKPKPINELNPDADDKLVRIAEKAMAPELKNRYAEMDDIMKDLNQENNKMKTTSNTKRNTPKILAGCLVAAVLFFIVFAALFIYLNSLSFNTSSGKRRNLILGSASQHKSQTIYRRKRKSKQPIVTKTFPNALDNAVDPSLKKITATFNQPMMDHSWSWTGGGDTFPTRNGEIFYDAKKVTCTMPVTLKPGHVYWIGINSPSHKNFKTANGVPAQRYVILFATKDRNGKPTEIPAGWKTRATRINANDSVVETSKPNRKLVPGKDNIKPTEQAILKSESLSVKGWQVWAKQKYVDAEKMFQEAVALNPKNGNAWNGLGWSQNNQGMIKNAKHSFLECIKLKPINAGALNGLGWIARKEGKTEQAISYWQKALKASPYAGAAINGLAMTYYELKDYDKSIKYYKQLLKHQPNSQFIKQRLKEMEQK